MTVDRARAAVTIAPPQELQPPIMGAMSWRSRPSLRRQRVLVLLALCLCAAGDAHAQSARTLLKQGNEHFAAGDYQRAFESFKKGHETAPSPVFLRSMAFCKLKLYRHSEAQELLRQYVKTYPQEKDRAKIQRTLEDLSVVTATKISIRSRPAGADVYLDTEAAGKVGVTPYDGTIEPGEHTVILVAPGFETTTRSFTIAAKKSVQVAVDLEVPLRIESEPPGASVHVASPESAAIGRTPLDTSLKPGARLIFLKRDGFQTFKMPVAVTAAQNEPRDARPGPARAVLSARLLVGARIETRPSGATVRLDGKLQAGRTPLSLAATPGPHTIDIALPGFKKQTRAIEFTPGSENRFDLPLTGGLLSMRTDLPGARVTVGELDVGQTPLQDVPVPLGAQRVRVEHARRRDFSRSVEFGEMDAVRANVTLGRRSWPFWTMAAVSAGAFIASIATFAAAMSKTDDFNERDVFSGDQKVGTGWCTNGPEVAEYQVGGTATRVTDLYGSPGATQTIGEQGFSSADCTHSYHHTTTALLSIGSAGAIGALVYYLFYMRPKVEIARQPRGQATSAHRAGL